ncbi:MAG: hypothetical protein COB93_10645 [Sneathiella sp.]|nr:MAG: hypothetical protein COB93_10645 [Sneathiella sp.]
MSRENMNNIVAKELSDALAKCNEQGIDASTVRTGLLTITIANFVNGIGLENTAALFAALPNQIQSGLFHKYANGAQTPPPAPVPAPMMMSPTPATHAMPAQPMFPTAVSRYSPEASPFSASPAEEKPVKRRRI